jgi:hypothetical protein
LLVPEEELPLAPPVLLGLWVEDEPMEPEDEPLEEPPVLEPELEGLELELGEAVPPAAPLCPASHSERESLPSWSLSSLSNSLEEPEAELDAELGLEEDDVPPAAELGLDDELDPEVPPAAEDDGEDVDDLSLCDMDGEEDDAPELLLLSPAA